MNIGFDVKHKNGSEEVNSKVIGFFVNNEIKASKVPIWVVACAPREVESTPAILLGSGSRTSVLTMAWVTMEGPD